jgi:hypothetical protein
MAAMAGKGEVALRLVAAALHCRFIGENVLTDGSSILIGEVVKIPNRSDVACKVSSAKRVELMFLRL